MSYLLYTMPRSLIEADDCFRAASLWSEWGLTIPMPANEIPRNWDCWIAPYQAAFCWPKDPDHQLGTVLDENRGHADLGGSCRERDRDCRHVIVHLDVRAALDLLARLPEIHPSGGRHD